jgi:hypothetical protein
MIKIILLFIVSSLFIVFAQAQHNALESPNKNVHSAAGIMPSPAYFTPVHFHKSECISEEDRQLLNIRVEKNRKMILEKNPDAFKNLGEIPSFILPVQPKAGFNDPGYYTLNFQVDHEPLPGNNLLDYNCGQRTYDWSTGNHAGTDYILWPYPWKRMQEEVMEIIAAAPGIIVDKRDGFYDQNCVNAGNPNWNGIVLEHADGSHTWYLHFKDGAITTKEIGDSVIAGEYLGAAGSSGSSNWPHLHFEVRDVNNNVIDPFAGPCNSMNTDSWWESQPAYHIPTINRISTHYSTDFDDTCPNIENSYEEVNFNPGDLLVIRLFYRDIQQNALTELVIKDPMNEIYTSWSWEQSWGQDYATAMAYWYFNVTSAWPQGVYTLEATFGGNSYETLFGVGTTLNTDNVPALDFEIYPNPVSGELLIQSEFLIDQVTIFDVLGNTVFETASEEDLHKINTESLKTGVYIIQIQTEGHIIRNKFLKK